MWIEIWIRLAVFKGTENVDEIRRHQDIGRPVYDVDIVAFDRDQRNDVTGQGGLALQYARRILGLLQGVTHFSIAVGR